MLDFNKNYQCTWQWIASRGKRKERKKEKKTKYGPVMSGITPITKPSDRNTRIYKCRRNMFSRAH
jgi:hypothetical protein